MKIPMMANDLAPLGQAGEWIAAVTLLKPFVEKILGNVAEEVGGILSDPIADFRKKLSERRARRFLRVMSSATQQIEGVEPVQVPDYIALPLIESATLVDDDGLQEKWASLLANAAHPSFNSTISPLFPKILASLSPQAAKFLDIYFDCSVQQMFVKVRPIQASGIVSHSRVNDSKLAALIGSRGFRWTTREKAFTIDNLIGQGVLRRDQAIDPKSYMALAGKLFAEGKLQTPYKLPNDVEVHMENFYELTVLGAEFVIACRPPNRRP